MLPRCWFLCRPPTLIEEWPFNSVGHRRSSLRSYNSLWLSVPSSRQHHFDFGVYLTSYLLPRTAQQHILRWPTPRLDGIAPEHDILSPKTLDNGIGHKGKASPIESRDISARISHFGRDVTRSLQNTLETCVCANSFAMSSHHPVFRLILGLYREKSRR